MKRRKILLSVIVGSVLFFIIALMVRDSYYMTEAPVQTMLVILFVAAFVGLVTFLIQSSHYIRTVDEQEEEAYEELVEEDREAGEQEGSKKNFEFIDPYEK